MADATSGIDLGHVAALLAAGVVAVPVFRKIGLGSVLLKLHASSLNRTKRGAKP